MQDRHWRSALHIFTNCPSLIGRVEKYIDLDDLTIDFAGLKRISRPWSQSEKFMLNLALHLFDETNQLANLSDMDYLDPNNKQIALKAINFRYAM
ncbi:hypothetical protein D3C76_51560 [compost metagenome]